MFIPDFLQAGKIVEDAKGAKRRFYWRVVRNRKDWSNRREAVLIDPDWVVWDIAYIFPDPALHSLVLKAVHGEVSPVDAWNILSHFRRNAP